MTKRFIAFLICMAMMLAMLPASTMAAPNGNGGFGGSSYGTDLGWYYASISENRDRNGNLSGYDVSKPSSGKDYSAKVRVSYEGNGSTTNWTEEKIYSNILSSTSTAKIHITCDYGYYISYIVLCCDDNRDNPFNCQTVGTEDAYGMATAESVPTSVTLNVSDLRSKANHGSRTDTYFLMVMVEPVPTPAHVGYSGGSIHGVAINATPVDTTQYIAGSNGWNAPYPTIAYAQGQSDYAYHGLLGISPEAEAEANAMGYSFAGWKLDYYHNYSTNTNVFSDELAIGDDRLTEGTQIPLYTHALLTAIWQPMETITIQKTWDDSNDQDGLRPNTLTVYLRATNALGAYTVREVVLTAESNWQTTFHIPMYDTDGHALTYSVTEETIEGYTGSITSHYESNQLSFSIVNTHSTLTTSIHVLKSWNDSDDRDGLRPQSVSVQLYADGVAVGEAVELSNENNWLYSWTSLPQYAAGKAIVYTVVELDVPDGYESQIQTDAYTGILNIINTHDAAKTQVTVSKVWEDKNDQDGIRPTAVTVELYANNAPTGITAQLSEENGWRYTFTGLQMNFGGTAIVYSVQEVDVPQGYNATIRGDMTNGFVITNTHAAAMTQVSVRKVWQDAENQDGIRPAAVTVHLLANGTDTGKTLTLEAGNNWKGMFLDLPVYENGSAIVYSVSEETVAGYTGTIEGNAVDGYVITNTHIPAITAMEVVKVWEDGNDQDGLRPNTVTVYLLANGVNMNLPLTLSESNGWRGTWSELPMYQGGVAVNYTVAEAATPGYSAEYDDSVAGRVTITNRYTPSVTAVTVQKEWRDNNDQDGLRPASVEVALLANGIATGKSLVLTAENHWKATFSGLAQYENGVLIQYTVEEITQVNGYDTTVSVDPYSGVYLIVNTHEPETISVPVSKIWNDRNDQDGIRPDSVTVVLYADGQSTGLTLQLSAANGWAGAFENVAKFSYGTEVIYTVEEQNIPTGYTATYSGTTITNTHIPETTTISVQKVWQDHDNQDGIRPSSLTIALYANGQQVATLEMNPHNQGHIVFENLPVYENGERIEYTVLELNVPQGYSAAITGNAAEGFVITNTHQVAKTTMAVQKIWDDRDDQDGKRPASITVHLLANGEHTGMTVILSESNGWSAQWTDLDAYRNGTKINYTVYEEAVEGYNAAYTRHSTDDSLVIITNTYIPEKTAVSLQKVWEDGNDQDGIRPDSVTIELYADGVSTGNTVTLTAENHWKYTFAGLDKYADGKAIVYTVVETTTLPGYTVRYETDAYTGTLQIINTHIPATMDIAVSKVWQDNANQDGIRPGSVTAELYADGIATGITLQLSQANGWSGQFTGMDQYSAGKRVDYTVVERDIPAGYTATYAGDETTGFVITNTHAPETTQITITKIWNDQGNQDGIRPAAVTVYVYANGTLVDTVELTAQQNWKVTLSGLAKYQDGQAIVYTVEEVSVTGYTGSYEGLVITNTHIPETTQLRVSKVWNDRDDQDGLRPASITVHLLANGEHTGMTQILSEGNGWSAEWTELAKFSGGVEINYTVYEETVSGYSATYTRDSADARHVIITNTYAPQTVSLTVLKVWEDNHNQDGLRLDQIQFELYANGKPTGTIVTLSADNHWSYTFTQLSKMENGKTIVYSAVELTQSQHYTVSYTTDSGVYKIVNTHIPATTSLSVTKIWNDQDNQDGIRPAAIRVQLFADGEFTGMELTLTAENGWSGSFENLAKFSYGTEVIYTVEEAETPGYTARIDGNGNHITITNTHAPEMVDIPVQKLWDDGNNQDGIRPESVTVMLLSNGSDTGLRLTLSAKNGWANTFRDLPKYENGKAITYTIRELEIPAGYTASYAGYTVTNHHTPSTTSLTVIKAWDDGNDQDGLRPDQIVVHLLANGEHTGMQMILTRENGWMATWTDLPEKHNGTIIHYTVWEESVSAYAATYAREGNTITITNAHAPAVTSVFVEKLWDDADDRDRIRPDKVLMVLLANGVSTQQVLELNQENNWFGQWSDLPMFANGKEVVYTVEEMDITPGYQFTVRLDSENRNFFYVTNHYAAATTSITVTKLWLDDNDQRGLRPDYITAALFANGTQLGDVVILSEENQWSYTWEKLYINEDGAPIVYSVRELDVPKGYTPGFMRQVQADGSILWTLVNMATRTPVPRPTEPETELTEPETEPTEPETEPTVPETEPTEPETEPTVPETEPTEPETEPTEPETEPTVPETEPTEPETEPTEPETEPTEPETEPTVPETEPTEPETEPTEPETEPTEPVQVDPPKMGVESHLDMYFVLMIVSLAGVLVLSTLLRKERNPI